jgi:predicted Zn-dependent peptidase
LGQFKKTTLSNGIRVVSEWHPHSKAAAIGVWIQVGTRDESREEAGISHFLEHLVFKGTKTRSPYQIVKSLEELGGELNAYTTKEYTVYHSLVLKDHWRKGLEVLSDIVSNMSLTKDNFELEKEVVLSEIASQTDSLEEYIFEEYIQKIFGAHSLGRPILGNEKSIKNISQKSVNEYYTNHYTGSNIIVSCAGHVQHDELVEYVEKYLGHKVKSSKSSKPKRRSIPKIKPFREVLEKPSDQMHLLLGLGATSFTDQLRFEAYIINTLLGGGMTSKLYQNVREKKGLAYSIYSSLQTFTDTGLLLIYSACETKQLKSLAKVILQELNKVKNRGVGKLDLKLFKTQVTGAVLLGSEDIENRMTSLAVNEMVLERYKPVSEVVDEINKVSLDSINHYIDKHFNIDSIGGMLMGSNVNAIEDWWKEIL